MADGAYFDIGRDEMDSLLILVPPSVLLPVEPTKLTEPQRVTLSKMICNDLGDVGARSLENVYVESYQRDMARRRYIDHQHLQNILEKNRMYLHPDTFRLLASQFVDPRVEGAVDYEQFIRFIARALDMLNTDNVYRLGSMSRERQTAKLLTEVQNTLLEGNYHLDLDRWSRGFEQTGQEAVPRSKIRDMCYQQKLPLETPIINKILELVEDTSRDGLYRWRSFLEFLVKAMPQRALIQHSQVSPRRDPPPEMTPRRGYELTSHDYGQQQARGALFTPRGNQPRRGYYTSPRDLYRHHEENGRFSTEPRDARLEEISQKLIGIEERNAVARESIQMTRRPWIDRFMKLAEALYRRDNSNKGTLPRDEVVEVFNVYNKAYDLDIGDSRVNQLINDPRVIDTHGNIILHSFLFALESK